MKDDENMLFSYYLIDEKKWRMLFVPAGILCGLIILQLFITLPTNWAFICMIGILISWFPAMTGKVKKFLFML